MFRLDRTQNRMAGNPDSELGCVSFCGFTTINNILVGILSSIFTVSVFIVLLE